MRKINQKREKRLKNEEYADRFKVDEEEDPKKKKKELRADKIKKRDYEWWKAYHAYCSWLPYDFKPR